MIYMKNLELLLSSDSATAQRQILCDQVEKLERLLKTHDQTIDSRKAINASIGKIRRTGGDISPIIEQAKKLSTSIDEQKAEIDALTEQLTIQCRDQNSDTLGPRANAHTDEENSQSLEPTSCSAQNDVQMAQRPGQFLTLPHASDIDIDGLCIRNDIDGSAWNAYALSNPCSTHYHQHEWRDLLVRNFRQQTHYLAACDSSGKVFGIATAVRMQSMVVETGMLSTPFLIYGGPIADDPAVGTLLANRIEAIARQSHCNHVQLRECHARKGWACDMNKVSMVLALPASIEALNKGFGSKLRSQVKRATRESPTIEFGGLELVADFYHVFSRKMRDHGTPVYARRFFEDIASTFPGSTRIAVVRLNNKPVAAAFLLSYRNTVEVPWAASIRKFDRLGTNMYMYHCLLEDAVKRRYKYFDFGRSTVGGETWRFKKQWGAKEHQLFWHTKSTTHETSVSTTSEQNAIEADSPGAAMRLAIQTWKRLPVGVANTIGPILARQLPW